MSKKKNYKKQQLQQHKKQQQKILPQEVEDTGISKKGKKIIIASIFGLTVGFTLLKFTNPEGNNWASFLSPMILLLSYISIAVGLLIRD